MQKPAHLVSQNKHYYRAVMNLLHWVKGRVTGGRGGAANWELNVSIARRLKRRYTHGLMDSRRQAYPTRPVGHGVRMWVGRVISTHN